jgi:streptogramin lyase
MVGMPAFRSRVVLGAALLAAVLAATPATSASLHGRVTAADGAPVVGAMVTVQAGDPAHGVTVFSDADGHYATPELISPGPYVVRVRRIGWRDLRLVDASVPDGAFDLTLERETDPVAVAAQLPANRWYRLVLERIDDPARREELKRQCTFCHQQGSWATRRVRDPEEWRKLLALMGRMGGMVGRDLRETIPELFNEVYAPERAVPVLTAGMGEPGFAPPPPPEVRRAVIDEWELGGRASMQHDVVFHRGEGRLYSVDMAQDRLYRLDPAAPDGARESFEIPNDGVPLGGAFRSKGRPLPPSSNSHVGPHSIQVAPDGKLWITLAPGNRLAGFDPKTETWTIHRLDDGYYPHTLRFDARGRIWYTIAASNHVGMFDPASGESHEVRLPAPTLGQEITMRMLPVFLFVGRYVDLRGMAAETEEATTMPVPYGIDVAPDGAVWFSQLNAHRIGRVDPDDLSVEIVETPFPAPRRLRFDSKGTLWIPSFSDSLVASFDPETRAFREWKIEMPDALGETPYALHVDRRADTVWICGTNSDSLIRFEPDRERFTVYPLPTRVTYTREVSFDAQGRVWTSNSNSPAWQIEGGIPRVIRLDPDGRAPTSVAGTDAGGE